MGSSATVEGGFLKATEGFFACISGLVWLEEIPGAEGPFRRGDLNPALTVSRGTLLSNAEEEGGETYSSAGLRSSETDLPGGTGGAEAVSTASSPGSQGLSRAGGFPSSLGSLTGLDNSRDAGVWRLRYWGLSLLQGILES